MEATSQESTKSRKSEVTIAFIGLVGVLATATFSNWDKMFPDKTLLQAKISGYRATGNFETELRYYFEVSGARQLMAQMQKQLVTGMKANALAQDPEHSQEISMVFKEIEDDPVRFDDVIAKFLPLYQKYFTIQEIQELNRFYSTEPMQALVKKMPLLTQEAVPIQLALIEEYQTRIMQKIQANAGAKQR